MLNKKGQSLISFVLLLPIMLGVMALVIDVGNAVNVKNTTNNVINMVMDVALDKNMEPKEIQKLLDYNLSDQDNQVIVKDNHIIIKSVTHVDGIFSKMFKFSGFQVVSEYIGSVENGKKVTNKRR